MLDKYVLMLLVRRKMGGKVMRPKLVVGEATIADIFDWVDDQMDENRGEDFVLEVRRERPEKDESR